MQYGLNFGLAVLWGGLAAGLKGGDNGVGLKS